MEKQLKIIVRGKVQGVYFRKTTQEKAQKLGLKGKVRNEPDGSVLIYVKGNEKDLEAFIDFCHIGPERARVEQVKAEPLEDPIEASDFIIER
jgi:acylphosphatase